MLTELSTITLPPNIVRHAPRPRCTVHSCAKNGQTKKNALKIGYKDWMWIRWLCLHVWTFCRCFRWWYFSSDIDCTRPNIAWSLRMPFGCAAAQMSGRPPKIEKRNFQWNGTLMSGPMAPGAASPLQIYYRKNNVQPVSPQPRTSPSSSLQWSRYIQNTKSEKSLVDEIVKERQGKSFLSFIQKMSVVSLHYSGVNCKSQWCCNTTVHIAASVRSFSSSCRLYSNGVSHVAN